MTIKGPQWSQLERWWQYVLMVMFILMAMKNGDRSFVDTAPVGELPDGDTNISDSNDLDVQQLENLKHNLGKTLEIMKTHSTIYTDVNGHRQAHSTTKEQVKTNGELFAQINQNINRQDDEIAASSNPPRIKIQTEVNIPSRGIHKTIIQEKPAGDTIANGDSAAGINDESVDNLNDNSDSAMIDVMDVAELAEELEQSKQQSAQQQLPHYTLPLLREIAEQQQHQQQEQLVTSAGLVHQHHLTTHDDVPRQDEKQKKNQHGEVLLPSQLLQTQSQPSLTTMMGNDGNIRNAAIVISSGSGNGGSRGASGAVMDNGNGGARRIISGMSTDQDNMNNNIEPYNTYLSSVQYSPLDMAEYIFWTGDEKGVTLAIEEFLRDGLMTPDEAIAFLQEIKFNLEYLQAHYSQPGVHSPDPQRLEQTKEHAYNFQRNDKFSGAIANQLMMDDPSKHTYDISELRQNIEKKNGGYVEYNPTEKSKVNAKPSANTNTEDTMSDEEYSILLERLRVADFLYTQYSLEEVIYQLAKVMFSQSLTRGSAEAQQALQKFTSFLESETAQGHISRSLEKKVLDVLIAALTDTLTEHPELVTAAREGLSGGTTPHLPAGNDILKQILEMTPEEREILKLSQREREHEHELEHESHASSSASSSSNAGDNDVNERQQTTIADECRNNNHLEHHHQHQHQRQHQHSHDDDDDQMTSSERVERLKSNDSFDNAMGKYKT